MLGVSTLKSIEARLKILLFIKNYAKVMNYYG